MLITIYYSQLKPIYGSLVFRYTLTPFGPDTCPAVHSNTRDSDQVQQHSPERDRQSIHVNEQDAYSQLIKPKWTVTKQAVSYQIGRD